MRKNGQKSTIMSCYYVHIYSHLACSGCSRVGSWTLNLKEQKQVTYCVDKQVNTKTIESITAEQTICDFKFFGHIPPQHKGAHIIVCVLYMTNLMASMCQFSSWQWNLEHTHWPRNTLQCIFNCFHCILILPILLDINYLVGGYVQ